MLIPTLETFSKFYLDYLNKQKDEGEEKNKDDDGKDKREG
jgi:hypothetical protein